jgi:hypothetical protein
MIAQTLRSVALTFEKRVGLHWTCAIPAAVLSAAWCDTQEIPKLGEIAFIQVYRALGDGDYLARRSSEAEDVHEGYTHLITEEQLDYALPYDCRLRSHPSERICKILCAHAAIIRPAVPKPPEPVDTEAASLPDRPVLLHPVPTVPLTLLDIALTVPQRGAAYALSGIRHVRASSTNIPTMRLDLSKPVTRRKINEACVLLRSQRSTVPHVVRAQQALLKLALQQLKHTSHQESSGKPCLCNVFKHLLRWQRETQQRVVNPVSACDADGVLWLHLMVSAPDEVLTACAA